MDPTAPHPESQPVYDAAARTRDLLALLRGRKRLLVMTHTNPDPDSLGSAMGLCELAEQVAGIPSTIAMTGQILRAENQAMVRELEIPLTAVADVDFAAHDCIALVDAQPAFGNTLVPTGTKLDIVVDHHVCADPNQQHTEVPFHDVRIGIGATSTVVTSYLMEAGVQPSRRVATALAYGLRTDTADLSRNVSDLDLRAFDFLLPHVDRQKMVAITRPRLPPAYYVTLRAALSKVRIYGDLVLCSIGRTRSAEMVAEVADLLIRMQGARAVFCGGMADNTYFVSVRTDPAYADAWRLIREAIGDEPGSCGGHGSVAGGSIRLPDGDHRTLMRLERRLDRNIRKALDVMDVNPGFLGDTDD